LRASTATDFGPPGVGIALPQGNLCGSPGRHTTSTGVSRRRGKFSCANGQRLGSQDSPERLSLQVTDLASAIAYAEAERWFANSPIRKDWIYLTRTVRSSPRQNCPERPLAPEFDSDQCGPSLKLLSSTATVLSNEAPLRHKLSTQGRSVGRPFLPPCCLVYGRNN
jgi:hypothetical protein